jgi:hypothetical protein
MLLEYHCPIAEGTPAFHSQISTLWVISAYKVILKSVRFGYLCIQGGSDFWLELFSLESLPLNKGLLPVLPAGFALHRIASN